jgi:hypothetical protein
MPSLAELPNLTGFFSYSRRDDEHSQGSLSRLRAQIYNELRLQLGLNFKLWQDTVAIPEGTEWEGEIKQAISDSVFFIPIVTPSSVASPYCRMEFEAFLAREETLGRKNLVFPLLYVRVPALEKEELWRQDPLLGIIGRRQYFDWQKFRHRSFTEGEIAERIEHFCQNIVESLHQPWMSPAERRAAEEAEAKQAAEQARRDQEEKERQQADAEARRQAEQQRRAAAEAEAQRAMEQARRDQEEKKRQQADAEARRHAEQRRQTAEQAEARRLADQARRDHEKKKRQQADADAWQEAEYARWAAIELRHIAGRVEEEKQRARRSRLTRLLVTLAVALVALVLLLVVWSVPSPSINPPDVAGCRSFRTTNDLDGKDVAILADDNPEAAAAAQSARSAATQAGFNVVDYTRQRLEEAQTLALRWQLRNANVVVICGSPSRSFLLELKRDGLIR